MIPVTDRVGGSASGFVTPLRRPSSVLSRPSSPVRTAAPTDSGWAALGSDVGAPSAPTSSSTRGPSRTLRGSGVPKGAPWALPRAGGPVGERPRPDEESPDALVWSLLEGTKTFSVGVEKRTNVRF